MSGELLAAGAEAPGRHADRVRHPLAVGDAEEVLTYWSAKTTERLTELKTRGALSYAPAGAESSDQWLAVRKSDSKG